MEQHLPFKKIFKKEEKLECGHLWSQTTSTKIPSKLCMDFNKDRISSSVWIKGSDVLHCYVLHKEKHGLRDNGV